MEQNGAAIYNYGGVMTLIDCVFKNNRASSTDGEGGVIYSWIATAVFRVERCEFTDNYAEKVRSRRESPRPLIYGAIPH